MPDPWERRPKGESKRAHDGLLDYCMMGSGRNLRALHKQYVKQVASGVQAKRPPTTKISTLFTWSARNDWPDRAAAWDAHLRTTEEDKWAIFLEELREKERGISDGLLEKAEQMLKFPIARVIRNDEAGVTKVEPADWKLVDATKMAAEGSRLGRKAAGADEDGDVQKLEIIIRKVGGGMVEEM